MDGYYNRRQDLITVMEVEADVSRVCKVIYTEALAIAALFISVLTLLSFEIPVMTISNDFEYVWDIKGKMLMTGITVDGCGITTFNPVILIFISWRSLRQRQQSYISYGISYMHLKQNTEKRLSLPENLIKGLRRSLAGPLR